MTNTQKKQGKYYIPYFTHVELACKDTGKVLLANGFADKLAELRATYNKPMIVNSCCRSFKYNRKIGGTKGSFHVYDKPYYPTGGTCAIDIHMPNSKNKGDLIAIAWSLGWSIGIYRNFLHLDRRSDYTDLQQIVFAY